MTLSPQWLDELRSRVTLSTLIGRTVKLTRAGREWKACCPFHNEKTPSFTINDEKGFWHCFGCSAHGDAIRWMTDQRGLSFIDAVKELAAEAGMEVPASDPKAAEKAKEREGLIDINRRASDFFKAQICREMDQSKAAWDYMAARLSGATATLKKFEVGYAPDSKFGSPSVLMPALGCDPVIADQLGLVRRNPDTGKVIDFFRRRIIIPIHDARGGVIGFGGRIVGEGEPKYLNTPDTPVFDKGRTLFNIHRASPPARAKGRLLIVEGYMDVIGLDSVGCDYAVAPNGTALTEQQLFLAWKLVDVPVVCFDGDKAGRKAAVRAANRALPVMEPGRGLSFAFPPEGKDPDDLAREGGLEAVNALVEGAVPLVEVIWRDLIERNDLKNPDQRARLAAEIRSLLASIKNGDVREAYATALRERFGGASSRSNAAPRRGSQSGNVSIAVEAALVLGIVDIPEVIDEHKIDVTRFRWASEDHKSLAIVIYDAGAERYGEPITHQMALAAVEKAGMTDFVRELRQKALRMPFSHFSNRQAAMQQLADALRMNFNPRS